MLTISKLKQWSINYYIDTAQAAEHAARDLARAGDGLGEYYSERETRTPAWLLAGDTHTIFRLIGLDRTPSTPGETPTRRRWPVGWMTASHPTVHTVAYSGRAAYTGSI
jgi:hypothetical protein